MPLGVEQHYCLTKAVLPKRKLVPS